MIDHTGYNVSDFQKSKNFYLKALKPIRYEALVVMSKEQAGANVIGFGEAPKPDFWMVEGTPQTPHIHIAFRAETRAQVDEFYKAAMEAGGRDNGKPGLRRHYHANYYGAFVLDPDGHNVEVVCHGEK